MYKIRQFYFIFFICFFCQISLINGKYIGGTLRFRKQLKVSTEIYIAKVISREERVNSDQFGKQFITITKLVRLHTWKGEVKDTILIVDGPTIGCCGPIWSMGATYIVYSTNQNIKYCGERTWLLDKNRDVRRLNRNFKEQKYSKVN